MCYPYKKPTKTAVKIEVLKRAKITLGKFPIDSIRGICAALIDVSVDIRATEQDRNICHELRLYIQNALGNYTWLNGWLDHHKMSTSDYDVRQARLLWIDWMIASLEGKQLKR
jgi:hypothetical protein